MEESVACVRCSVNARHERKLKNKLGDFLKINNYSLPHSEEVVFEEVT